MSLVLGKFIEIKIATNQKVKLLMKKLTELQWIKSAYLLFNCCYDMANFNLSILTLLYLFTLLDKASLTLYETETYHD